MCFLGADTGSRGAGGVKNTILTYFQAAGGGGGAGSGTSGAGSGNNNFQHINGNSGPGSSVAGTGALTSSGSGSGSGGTLPCSGVTQSAGSGELPPPSAAKGWAVTTAAQVQHNNILELKKQVESYKLAKDLADSKVRRKFSRPAFCVCQNP
jgi:hypothetical protein